MLASDGNAACRASLYDGPYRTKISQTCISRICTKFHEVSRSFTNFHEVSLTFTNLHEFARSFTNFHVTSCDYIYQICTCTNSFTNRFVQIRALSHIQKRQNCVWIWHVWPCDVTWTSCKFVQIRETSWKFVKIRESSWKFVQIREMQVWLIFVR